MYNKKEYDRKRYLKIRKTRTVSRPVDPITVLTKTEMAYIAGIIDGEGTIYARNEKKRKTIYPTVAVHMTDRAVIEWMAQKIKAQKVCTVQRKELTKCGSPLKKQYLFRLSGKRMKLLCKALYPYLITKKRHAEIISRWPIDAKEIENKGSLCDIFNLRISLGEELTNLNGNIYRQRHP